MYIGAGAEITFGNDNGNSFFTGRLGLGVGGGIAFDKDGKIPGPEPENRCEGGVVLAATAKADFRGGPSSLGLELGAARNYTDQVSRLFLEPTASLAFPSFGVEASASVGAQYTVYWSRH